MILINDDCLKGIQKLIDLGVKVDCVVTDPPYRVISGGKDLKTRKWEGSVLEKNDGKIFEHNNIDHEKWLKLCYEVMREDSQIYIMTNLLNLFVLKETAEKVGFKLHNLLIWEKNNSVLNKWYMKNCEYTLFLRKGKAFPIYEMGHKTVHKFDNLMGNKLHPTQKPIDLMEYYITASTKENEIVLDPFMGSGTTGEACGNLGRDFIGIELDKNYFDIAKQRLEKFKPDIAEL